MTSIISMTGINKSFPGVRALKNAQFDLRAGEVHALMGENGAGKSTLMKILAGIYRPDYGEILIDGKVTDLGSPRAALLAGICIIHQELILMPHLTAAQNILIGREPRKAGGLLLDEEALNGYAAALFKRMNLNLDPRTKVSSLTIAKQQMVEIAKALSFKSRILIMDEPTAALNDAEINELFSIINSLKAIGVGIVYISHKMDEIKRIADRVTVMRDGAYVGTVDADEVPISKIISMMVGREIDNEPVSPPDLSAAPIVLDVRNLTRGQHVRNVSFALRAGEILGFAGLMGAGRTEVARLIFGADKTASGEIFIGGRKVDIRSPQDAVRNGIGYLSEDRKLLGLAVDLDVRNNIALASLSRFTNAFGLLDEESMHRAATDYIQKLVIKTPSDRQPSRLLSGGNQQKIVIAKWLLRDCQVLIFDEPTRGIDIGAKSEIYKLLNALAAQGKAIIVISSELPEILRLSHRIAVMCEGRLTGFLPAGASQEEIMHLATLREPQMTV